MLPKLKPCPFCGYNVSWGDGAYKEPHYIDIEIFSMDSEFIYNICCPYCEQSHAYGDTLEELVVNWNKRVK